ncbi:aminotransferase class V-fold PLP-dependent enzyme [Methanoplanus endosymbiosus]|uniref:Aminotransferase class V-fold PLP-dependent enzyme n=1 Tax=Methanoplanus endosymbiosus TaxID=33865 RepID=A0A9E7PK82_9EURY|nr:aminotransferase class V-fold PLP-dependent enzyme [Methanoplanus endosymbiosus]UUX91503.1 aminotransferase class V-fold PLP-dependent enzyme [Methanoplanus endosymbiosus]
MEPIIYLNNAATTWPKPDPVIKAVEQSFTLPYFEEGRSSVPGQIDYPTLARETLAGFFRVKTPDNFIFTQNATDSLNTVIHGFVNRQGSSTHVITTDLEHNAVLRPLRTLEVKNKISLTVLRSENGYITPESVRESIKEDTSMAVMTHGSNVLGTVQDIGSIGKILRKKDIFFCVDAAQTAGEIPVNLSKTPVDALVFTGHKALFGLQGIGGLYIADPERIDPLRQGGTGANSKYPLQPYDMPMKFEAGTPNYPGIVSLIAGINYINDTGPEEIRKRTMGLTKLLIDGLKYHPEIILYNQNPDLPVISFNINGIDNYTVSRILARGYSIITRAGLHCAPLINVNLPGAHDGTVRLSPSYLNTENECRKAIEAISEVAGSEDKEIQPA